MGQSTDAILFYGYCWQEECNLLPDDNSEWENVLLRKRGVRNPWDDYPSLEIEVGDYASRRRAAGRWCDDNRAALDAWHAAKEGVRKGMGCDIGYHCSGECPMPYVYVTDSRTVAHRGCPKSLDLTALSGRPTLNGWGGLLDGFMEALEICRPPDGHAGPAWWLVSNWC
jgi:hypothetical protein